MAEENNRWDQAGIWLSAICVVHCALTPVLLVALPSAQAIFESDLVHEILAVLLPLIAVAAFVPGFRRHRDRSIFLLALPGLALIIFAAFDPFANLHGFGEALVTMIGSVCLIMAHLRHRRLGHYCAVHAHPEHSRARRRSP